MFVRGDTEMGLFGRNIRVQLGILIGPREENVQSRDTLVRLFYGPLAKKYEDSERWRLFSLGACSIGRKIAPAD